MNDQCAFCKTVDMSYIGNIMDSDIAPTIVPSNIIITGSNNPVILDNFEDIEDSSI
jgi:hypothetical protein